MKRFVLGSVLLGAQVALLLFFYAYKLPQPVSTANLQLTIPKGSSLIWIAKKLKQQQIIKSKSLFVWHVNLLKQQAKLQAGEYAFDINQTEQDIIQQLLQGRVIQYSLTIVEGWLWQDVLHAMLAHPKIVNELTTELSGAEVMAKLGKTGSIEGVFFPDTYNFVADTVDLDLLKNAYARMESKLTLAWRQRNEHCQISKEEGLILASIIEKESSYPEEYHKIAGVYQRRLARKMRLQADPTVIYALGKDFSGRLLYKDLKISSPYNTYRNSGLPPTPIAIPSYAALRAVFQPDSSNALYFVANAKGQHTFTDTLADHLIAVQEFRQLLSKSS